MLLSVHFYNHPSTRSVDCKYRYSFNCNTHRRKRMFLERGDKVIRKYQDNLCGIPCLYKVSCMCKLAETEQKCVVAPSGTLRVWCDLLDLCGKLFTLRWPLRWYKGTQARSCWLTDTCTVLSRQNSCRCSAKQGLERGTRCREKGLVQAKWHRFPIVVTLRQCDHKVALVPLPLTFCPFWHFYDPPPLRPGPSWLACSHPSTSIPVQQPSNRANTRQLTPPSISLLQSHSDQLPLRPYKELPPPH